MGDEDRWDSIRRRPVPQPENAPIAEAMWSIYYNAYVQNFVPGPGDSNETEAIRALLIPQLGLAEAIARLREAAVSLDAGSARNRLRRGLRVLGLRRWLSADMVGDEARFQIGEATDQLGLSVDAFDRWSYGEAPEDHTPAELKNTCVDLEQPVLSGTRPATIKIKGKIERPIDDIRENIDPQGWDKCSTFFQDCAVDRLDNGSGAPGEKWDGVLFEWVGADTWWAVTRLDVEYHIDEDPESGAAQALRALYWLNDSGPIYNAGVELSTGLLTLDDGHYRADRIDADSTALEVEKTLDWVYEFPDELLEPMLVMWADELAEEGPCC